MPPAPDPEPPSVGAFPGDPPGAADPTKFAAGAAGPLPFAPAPACNVTRVNATFEPSRNAAMLERPLPAASTPVASGAMSAMS